MKDKLKEILTQEAKSLKTLLTSLDEQYLGLLNNEAIKLEVIVKQIDNNCREIAKWEVQRRSLLGDKEISLVIRELSDKELDIDYRNIKKLVAQVQVQKESNEMLIKQGLGFSTKILDILNPDRTPKTYKSNGKRR